MEEVLPLALARVRRRCEHDTSYKHEQLGEWLRAALALPQVASTLPDKQKYLKHIGRYADASARSKVANAVRSGRAAHDLQRDD